MQGRRSTVVNEVDGSIVIQQHPGDLKSILIRTTMQAKASNLIVVVLASQVESREADVIDARGVRAITQKYFNNLDTTMRSSRDQRCEPLNICNISSVVGAPTHM